jgi:hypothetical protein
MMSRQQCQQPMLGKHTVCKKPCAKNCYTCCHVHLHRQLNGKKGVVPCLGCGIGVKSKMGLCMNCGHDRVAHKHAYESKKCRTEFLRLAAIDV